MPTKAELEARVIELELAAALDEAEKEEPAEDEPVEDEQVAEEQVDLTPSGDVTKDTILRELEQFDNREVDSTYMVDVYGHRLEDPAFVRAFAWARRRGNELKACLIYADAHDGDFEESNEPVVKRD
jgi:hypothetical protein